MIKHIEEKNFDTEIKEGIVIIDFFATWCGPCKMFGLVLEKISDEIKFPILKVDVDECSNIAKRYEIYSVPTLILMKNGVEIKRISGYMDKNELKEWINSEK